MNNKLRIASIVLAAVAIPAVWWGAIVLCAPKAQAAQPAQIEEIAHTNTLAVYRVQDGGCTIYLAQGVQGIGPTGITTIALTSRCQ